MQLFFCRLQETRAALDAGAKAFKGAYLYMERAVS